MGGTKPPRLSAISTSPGAHPGTPDPDRSGNQRTDLPMTFKELRLAEPILRAVEQQGYTHPTPIQAQAIPYALEGRDVLGTAQTGTGKTCAFALPILHQLGATTPRNGRLRRGRTPRALVLAPTRELASQIHESFVDYGQALPLSHAVVYGGVNQARQVNALRNGVDVLIATPGRLLDLMDQGYVDLSEVHILVLDEADRMLDMGFINDIRKVVKEIPSEHQTLFFSATISKEIRKLADDILVNPALVETTPESTTVDAITQHLYTLDRANKPELLQRILGKKEVTRSLVFSKTKYGADKIVKALHRANINADAIHGNKTQNARTRALNAFKSGRVSVLVATDIASRGIDVDDITHVVNYDMPLDPETYVHRIGRTARAGAKGVAISFCDREELKLLREIQQRTTAVLQTPDDHSDLTFEPPAPGERPARRSGSRGNNRNGQGGRGSRGDRPGGRGKARDGDGDAYAERIERAASEPRAPREDRPSRKQIREAAFGPGAHSPKKPHRKGASPKGGPARGAGAKGGAEGEFAPKGRPSGRRDEPDFELVDGPRRKPTSRKPMSRDGAGRGGDRPNPRAADAKSRRSSSEAGSPAGRTEGPAKKRSTKRAPAKGGAKGAKPGPKGRVTKSSPTKAKPGGGVRKLKSKKG